MLDPHVVLSKVVPVWRWIRWRSVVVGLVWLLAFLAFSFGAETSQRAGIPSAAWFVRAYYAVGLFVLGGLDLGLPEGGPAFWRRALWVAFVLAPTITAGALIDGILQAINPQRWALRRMKHHFVIAGCGKLTLHYLKRLREIHPLRPVLIVELESDSPSIKEAREVYGAYVLSGNIASRALLELLQLDTAERVVLLTDDDLANLNAASQILALAPSLAGRLIVHLSDLQLRHAVTTTSLALACEVFNTHQLAAERLVARTLGPHFEATGSQDTVVIAGFGRFGQTVLDALQRHALGRFERVILVDLEIQRKANAFGARVGYAPDYERSSILGDLRDPALWATLEERIGQSAEAPVFVLASSDDKANLKTALWLGQKYANALVVVRHFQASSFIAEVATEARFVPCCEAEVLIESFPVSWLAP